MPRRLARLSCNTRVEVDGEAEGERKAQGRGRLRLEASFHLTSDSPPQISDPTAKLPAPRPTSSRPRPTVVRCSTSAPRNVIYTYYYEHMYASINFCRSPVRHSHSHTHTVHSVQRARSASERQRACLQRWKQARRNGNGGSGSRKNGRKGRQSPAKPCHK